MVISEFQDLSVEELFALIEAVNDVRRDAPAPKRIPKSSQRIGQSEGFLELHGWALRSFEHTETANAF